MWNGRKIQQAVIQAVKDKDLTRLIELIDDNVKNILMDKDFSLNFLISALFEPFPVDAVEVEKSLQIMTLILNANIANPSSTKGDTFLLYLCKLVGRDNNRSFRALKNMRELYGQDAHKLVGRDNNPMSQTLELFVSSYTTQEVDELKITQVIEKIIPFLSTTEINQTNQYGQSPFFISLQQHQTMIAQKLLIAGANTTCVNPNGITTLHLACGLADIALVDLLLKQGALLNTKDSRNFTPLDCAKDPQMILHLLKKGAVSTTKSQFHFFRIAEQTSHSALMDYLFEQGIATYQDPNDTTALHLLDTSDDNILERFLQQGADQFLTKQKNVLHLAVEHSDIRRIPFLLSKGADPCQEDDAGLYPLEMFNVDRFSLQQSGISIDVCITSLLQLLDQYPPNRLLSNALDLLLIAAECGSLPYVQLLCKKGASLVQRKPSPHQQFNALEWAAQKKDVSLLMWMLDALFLSSENKQYLSEALAVAISTHQVEAAKLLLAAGANMNQPTLKGQSIFSVLFWHNGYPGPNFKDKETLQKAFENTFFWLLENADVNQQNAKGETVLQEYFDQRNQWYHQPGLWPCMVILLREGIELPLDNSTLLKIVAMTARYGYHTILKQLFLRLPKSLGWIPELLSQTANIAVENADITLLKQLVSEGMKLDRPRRYGHTPALRYCLLDIALDAHSFSTYWFPVNQSKELPIKIQENQKLLLTYLIEQDICLHYPKITSSEYSVLHKVVKKGFVEVVHLLLKPSYGFDVNYRAATKRRETPLEIAVENGDIAMVNCLLEHGADPCQFTITPYCDDKKTLLYIACEKGDISIMGLLLTTPIDKEALCRIRIGFGKAIYAAANYEDSVIAQQMVAQLVKQGARVDVFLLKKAIEKNFAEPLLRLIIEKLPPHLLRSGKVLLNAIHNGNVTAYHLLVNACPDLLQQTDTIGRTALHYATSAKGKVFFKEILARGASLEAVDDEDFNVTVYALCHGTHTELGLALPPDFNEKEYQKLRLQIAQWDEFSPNVFFDDSFSTFSISLSTFKLIRVFSHAQTALTYIEKYQNVGLSPIHDLCLFQLPTQTHWDRLQWVHLLLQNGPSIICFLHWAPQIEKLLGKPPQHCDEIINIAKQIHYARKEENPELSTLFIRYQIPEKGFNRTLNRYIPKTHDNLPNIFIDGQEIGAPRFYLKKLLPTDLRGFVLGALTHCCQSVGSSGESCALHGMMSAYGGFYVVFKRTDDKVLKKMQTIVEWVQAAKDTNDFLMHFKEKSQFQKYANLCQTFDHCLSNICAHLQTKLDGLQEGEIVAQSWAWISLQNNLVLDSWERLRPEDDRLCVPFLEQLQAILSSNTTLNTYGIQQVLLGGGGQTPQNLPWKLVEISEYPRDFDGYRDSSQQYQIRLPEKLNIISLDDTLLVKTINNPLPLSSTEMVWTARDMDELLSYHFHSTPHVHLSNTIQLPLLRPEMLLTTLQFSTETLMIEQENVCILPLFDEQNNAAALIMEVGLHYENDLHNDHPKEKYYTIVTYLDMAGREPSQTLYMIPQVNSYQVHKPTVVYDERSTLSPLWVVEMLRRYAQTGLFNLCPITNITQVRNEQTELLALIHTTNHHFAGE